MEISRECRALLLDYLFGKIFLNGKFSNLMRRRRLLANTSSLLPMYSVF